MFYFLLIAEGFIGLALQMLFIRQLTPSVGSSAIISSWIRLVTAKVGKPQKTH